MSRERTSAQIYASPGELQESELSNLEAHRYRIYREMRKDPTLAFARMLNVAPLVVAGWMYEAKDYAPEGARDFIEEQLEPIRIGTMKAILEGYIDHGWTPFEIVLHVDDWNMIAIKKLKPLIQNATQILVDIDTGEYIGLRQELMRSPTGFVDLSIHDSLVIAIDVEGTYWYGQPLLENSRQPYEKWLVCEEGAARYDKKVAGTHLVVHYPPGTSPYEGVEEMDNFEIAKKIIASFEASGKIAVPRKMAKYGDSVDSTSEDAWKIELLTDSGAGKASFESREKYLDALKVRGQGLPERAVLEGQYGTKADAEAHADFAIVNMELRSAIALEQLNKGFQGQDGGLTNLLLELNYGRRYRDTVSVMPKPLTDEQRAFFKDIYKAFISNPELLMEEREEIDLETMRERLGVLRKEEGANGNELLTEFFKDVLQTR